MFDEEKYKNEICETMHRLYERNLISSVGGNISVIARNEGFVLITPSGLDKNGLKPSDIVKVDLAGKVLDNGKPSSETINHIEIYKSRKDINAIVHAHPPLTVGIVSSGYIPKAVTPEHILLASDITVVDFVSPCKSSVASLTKALEKSNIAIIKNHGSFSVGESLAKCFVRIEILEEVSKMLIAGKLFGGMPELSEKDIKDVIEKYGKIL